MDVTFLEAILMRKGASKLLLVLTVCLFGCTRGGVSQQAAETVSEAAPDPTQRVRPPCVAGQFYPSSADELRGMVRGYIEAAHAPELSGDLFAVMAPHAGYIYSGPVAGYSYAALKGKQVKTVILIGPSHRGMPLSGAALSSFDAWETPLGAVPVNQEVNRRLLAASSRFKLQDAAHAEEHSLEVQVPFLQSVLAGFSIVPIVFADAGRANVTAIAEAVASIADDTTIVIASTDLSHYPEQKAASEVDHAILGAICTMDADRIETVDREQLARGIPNLHCTACGLGPVVACIEAAKKLGASRGAVLHYANSAEVEPRTADRCVGYGAVAFTGVRRMPDTPPAAVSEGELDQSQQAYLLKLARDTIARYLADGSRLETATKDEAMQRERAVFVTLTKGGQLRGCIGQIMARYPLAEAVRNAAISAATEDPRFRPVTVGELASLHIEISVLSPMQPIDDYQDVVVGRHGVLVTRGMRSGVFLPQVAPEQGWDRDEMLRNLCAHKAGLPPDAYKDPETELYVFTAQVFGEPHGEGRATE
ncbi:MAG TPA: hypothetical protein DGT21_00320 [Armatimonadetes bacterium]|nr:hypothetical protein [Armatimonadota bacterium]